MAKNVIRSKAKARKLGRTLVVLSPEKGHPHPFIGYRLYQWNHEYRKWVLIMLGGEQVLDTMVEKALVPPPFLLP